VRERFNLHIFSLYLANHIYSKLYINHVINVNQIKINLANVLILTYLYIIKKFITIFYFFI
jgi:hypothetical protein